MVAQPIGTKKVPVTTPKRPAGNPVKKAQIAPTKVVQPAKNPVPALYKPTPTAAAQKKPLPAPAKKSPPQQQQQQQSWLTKGINAASSGLGNAAGAVVTAAGSGIAGAGKGAGSSIANSSRGWGDMVREYGNSVKDVTGAGGSRATTKTNPLGLSTGGVGAAASMAARTGGTAKNPLGL